MAQNTVRCMLTEKLMQVCLPPEPSSVCTACHCSEVLINTQSHLALVDILCLEFRLCSTAQPALTGETFCMYCYLNSRLRLHASLSVSNGNGKANHCSALLMLYTFASCSSCHSCMTLSSLFATWRSQESCNTAFGFP